MNKKIFIIITVITIASGLVFLILTLRQPNQTIDPNQPLPTPTVFQNITMPTPTRNPNILPLEVRQSEREYLNKTQLLQKLPSGGSIFSLKYINEEHIAVYSIIEDKELAYQEARSRLTENGIDITKIRIDYQ